MRVALVVPLLVACAHARAVPAPAPAAASGGPYWDSGPLEHSPPCDASRPNDLDVRLHARPGSLVAVGLKNCSSRPLHVLVNDFVRPLSLVLAGPSQPTLTSFAGLEEEPVASPADFLWLPPGEERVVDVIQFEVNGLTGKDCIALLESIGYIGLASGTYRVRVAYTNRASVVPDAWIGSVESKELSIALDARCVPIGAAP